MTDVARRQFLKASAAGATGVALTGVLASPALADSNFTPLTDALKSVDDVLRELIAEGKGVEGTIAFIRNIVLPAIEDAIKAVEEAAKDLGEIASGLLEHLQTLKDYFESVVSHGDSSSSS